MYTTKTLDASTALKDTQLQSTNCKPVTKLVYIKVPKTGSGTTTSIFDRYGFHHNLTFAVPKSDGSTIGQPLSEHTYRHDSIMRCLGGFDFLTNHMNFTKTEEVEKLVRGAIYISSIREPVSHFESLFYHYGIEKKFKDKRDPIDAFFRQDPFQATIGEFGPNYQLNYLGENNVKNSSDYFEQIFKRLDLKIDFIIIREHYIESLVLLKNMLCWDMSDVVYVSQHIRIDSKRKEKISDSLKSKIQRYNFADMKLYDYYNKTLWKKITAADQNTFWREVRKLQEMVTATQKTCVNNTKVFRGIWIENVANSDADKLCQDMVRFVGRTGNIPIKKSMIDGFLHTECPEKR